MLERLSTRGRIVLLVAVSTLPMIAVSLSPGMLGGAEPRSGLLYTLGTMAGRNRVVASELSGPRVQAGVAPAGAPAPTSQE